jgi:hypothetical protein
VPSWAIAAVSLLVTLQGATLGYVVKVESRLQRLETIVQLQGLDRPRAAHSLTPWEGK